MKSTAFSRWSSLIAAAFALAVSVPEASAFAQNANAESQAKALQKKAMEEDFLSVEFDKALDKLKQASNVCGDTKCPPLLRAQLKRDIGVVLVTGHSDKAKGEKAFVDAIRIDGSVAIDKDYRTPEVDAVFAEAKKKSGAGNSVINDFNHTPVPAQFVRTPVPVYVEYTGSDQLVRVIVRYKGFGMNEWKLLELHRISKGWGVSVPCDDVVQGNLLYFVQGYNAGGEAVALGGDKSNPFKVQIKNGSPDADAPHLPGEDAPAQCAEKQDCPPGFPCDKSTKKGGGASCEEDSECETGTCKEGACTSPAGRTKIWLGLNVGADLYFLGGEQNVCALETSKDAAPGTALTPLNPTGYYCINSDGKDFPSRDDKGVEATGLNKPGAVDGGANLGNIRVMLAFDYAIKENMLLGLRAGYAFNTYPGQAAVDDVKALPAAFHLEARYTYLFGGKESLVKGLAPYAFVGLGLSTFSAKIAGVKVDVTGVGPKEVDAWAVSGPLFASIGGGVRYAFSPKFALMLTPVKANLAFVGYSGFMLEPEVGVQFGL